MPIGEELRSARTRKGYSFEYVEDVTKIRAKYLQALEENNFDVLPGPVYAKAFLRTYSKFLELDTDEIMNEYNGLTNETTPTPIENSAPDVVDSVESSSKKWRYIVAGLAVIALIAFNTFYNTGNRLQDNKPEIPNTAQQQTTPSEDIPKSQPDDKQQQPVQGVRVVLKVTDTPSWMQVEADGSTVFSGTVRPGEMKDFQAQEKILLHVGNAGAVQVNVNGKELGRLGENGKVKRIPFTAGEEPVLTQG